MNKREFLKSSLVASAGFFSLRAFGAKKHSSNIHKAKFQALPQASELRELNLFADIPDIQKHHLTHYQSSADFLNHSNLGRLKLRNVFINQRNYSPEFIQKSGSFFNHRIYFKSVSGNSNTQPDKAFAKQIKQDFYSLEQLKDAFVSYSANSTSRGWCWLILTNGHLKITHTKENFNPIMSSIPSSEQGFPILALDMWEHAYKGTFGNNQLNYAVKYWDALDWEYLSLRYQRATNLSYLFA